VVVFEDNDDDEDVGELSIININNENNT